MKKAKKLLKKLFYRNQYFTIALRKRSAQGLPWESRFVPDTVLGANAQNWCADPMLADYNGKTYLFYEAVDGMHGRIEVREIHADASLGAPEVLFRSEQHHYSYPFVFRHHGQWYMIPEMSSQNCVTLFRAEAFPAHWKPVQILLTGNYVDTTVFELQGQWYLLTFTPVAGKEEVLPHAFRMQFSGAEFSLTPIAWQETDRLHIRGAGNILPNGSDAFRPAQVSTPLSYGEAVEFHRIAPKGDSYHESAVGRLTPENLHIPGHHIDGLHTYSHSESFEAVDVRCRDFDLLKPIKRLIHRR